MEEVLTIMMDDDPVRFTEDGKVSVIDAIKAITNSDQPHEIWEELQRDKPELLDYCESYSEVESGDMAFINHEGWEKIWLLMIEYLFLHRQ
ncbi:MAG: hypothetical protein JW896_18785 [Deltaproteobacteria bacterium]|nr:hypothetical protein [Deltaproteobacteria bacterium]